MIYVINQHGIKAPITNSDGIKSRIAFEFSKAKKNSCVFVRYKRLVWQQLNNIKFVEKPCLRRESYQGSSSWGDENFWFHLSPNDLIILERIEINHGFHERYYGTVTHESSVVQISVTPLQLSNKDHEYEIIQ